MIIANPNNGRRGHAVFFGEFRTVVLSFFYYEGCKVFHCVSPFRSVGNVCSRVVGIIIHRCAPNVKRFCKIFLKFFEKVFSAAVFAVTHLYIVV